MSLNQRRALYIFFILVFLTATPLISLYATGYKLGRGGFNFQKTGMLIIDTEPEGAKIYLDGEVQQDFFKKIYAKNKSYITTPAKIKNLLPGTYDVTVELPGFWPWRKKLTVHPGQSTFAEDISLFKKNVPELSLSGDFSDISVSPDNKNLLAIEYADDFAKFSLINLETESEKTFTASATDGLTLSWSPNNKKVIAGNFIFEIEDWDNPISLNKLIGPRIKNVKWDAGNGNKVYYESAGGINCYDLSGNTEKLILNRPTLGDYLPDNDYLYFVDEETGSANLSVWDLNDNKLFRKINLPDSTYTFLNPGHSLINLYDNTHDILYLIDPFSAYKPLLETVSGVKRAHWVSDRTLLFANDFEIWVLNLTNHKKTLLTRIGQTLTGVIWHPNNNYVIFTTARSINAIELDDREKYNITKLLELEMVAYPAINKEGDGLYFFGKIGNQSGLYKLYIQ